jgi:WD40 repeat protein
VIQDCNVPDTQILSLSWSPDGKELVSGGTEEGVRIWDVDTGQQVFVYSGHVLPPTIPAYGHNYPPTPFVQPHVEISAVAWSPNGEWIVSGDTTGFMRVWSAH